VTSPRDVLIEAGRLAAERQPYAFATVVRVERPTSAREGNHALIRPDGSVVGWIGGACSEPTVVREALRSLADGRPRLVAIDGACASEGLVEVFVEPQLPEPVLAVLGESPAADTLADLATRIGWRVTRELGPEAEAVVVATMGHADEEALGAALASEAGYVGLVASSRRAAAVLGALSESGVGEAALARVRSPAGLDLGPSRQEEIAVAVLAELVAWRHARPSHDAASAERLGNTVLQSPTVDPVCGMTVADARETASFEGVEYAFCSAGCRQRFEAEPERYVAATRR
jgi:xanthine dehydrogenase accessory factor